MGRKLGKERAHHRRHGPRLRRQAEPPASEKEEPEGHVKSHVGAVGHRRELRPDPWTQEPDDTGDFEVSGSCHDDAEREDEDAEGLFDRGLLEMISKRSFLRQSCFFGQMSICC